MTLKKILNATHINERKKFKHKDPQKQRLPRKSNQGSNMLQVVVVMMDLLQYFTQ